MFLRPFYLFFGLLFGVPLLLGCSPRIFGLDALESAATSTTSFQLEKLTYFSSVSSSVTMDKFENLVVVGTRIYGIGETAYGKKLFVSYDGTTFTQISNTNSQGSDIPSQLTVVGTTLYFFSYAEQGYSLFRHGDGEPLVELSMRLIVGNIGIPSLVTSVGNDFYFVYYDLYGGAGEQIYRVTSATTTLGAGNIISNFSSGGTFTEMKGVAGSLYFTHYTSGPFQMRLCM